MTEPLHLVEDETCSTDRDYANEAAAQEAAINPAFEPPPGYNVARGIGPLPGDYAYTPDPEAVARSRRHEALYLAIQLHTGGQNGFARADKVVEAAKVFQAFLDGDAQ